MTTNYRGKIIMFRVSDEEYEAIKKRIVEIHAQSVSEFVRDCVLSKLKDDIDKKIDEVMTQIRTLGLKIEKEFQEMRKTN